MNRLFTLMFLLAATSALSTPAFAARQIANGPGITPITSDGITNGVDMTGSAGTGTLTVGTIGGAQTDVFSANNPVGTVAGLAISTDASSTSNVTFNSSSNVYGNVGVTNPGGPFFLNINAGAPTATVNFLGSVYGTTLSVSGTGTVNFDSGIANAGSTNITATNFAGDGTIGLATNTSLTGAMTTTAGADTGTLNLAGGSIMDGAVGGAIGLKAINVVGGSNISGVSSTITGTANAYTYNLLTNTLNVGGALTTHAATGVINTTLVSPTLFGHIIPTGSSTIGTALTVNVAVDPTALITVGSHFNIVHGTSGTDGSTVTVQDPGNALYTFALVDPTTFLPIAGTVHGDITIAATGVPLSAALPADVPGAPLAAAVVPVLLAATPGADLTAVISAINALTNPADVANAAAQIAPSIPDMAAPQITFQGIRQFQDLWTAHMEDSLCGQVSQRQKDEETSTCRKNDSHKGWWIKGFGTFGTQDTKDSIPGYDTRILGTMLAYDMPLHETAPGETRAGLGIGYARSIIDGKTFSTGTDFNTYQATAYIGHERGPWFINGNASFGWNNYTGSRHILFTGVDRTAQADYNGQEYTGFATTGFHFFTKGFTLSPLASIQYSRLNLDSYRETGAGDINLAVNAQKYDFVESGLGIKVAHPVAYHDGTFVPEVHFKWLHEINSPTLKNTANLAGSPSFTTYGLKTGENTLDLGGGFTLLSCACSARTWAVEAVYDHNWRNNGYSDDQGMLKYSHRF